MPSPTYCPMGSPSLLNGNFSENVARLKYFSWSTILYGDSPEFDSRTRNEDLGSYQVFLELAAPFLGLVYVFTYFFIAIKSSESVEINRKFLISTYFWAVISIESFCIFMAIFSTDSPIRTGILCFYAHIFTGGMVFLYKCQRFRPFYTGKLEIHILKVMILLVVIKIFLFFPGLPINSYGCPPRTDRRQHEMLFWIVIGYQLLVYLPLKMMWLCWKSEEFGIYEDNVYVGKLMKDERSEWIELYDEKEKLIENAV